MFLTQLLSSVCSVNRNLEYDVMPCITLWKLSLKHHESQRKMLIGPASLLSHPAMRQV